MERVHPREPDQQQRYAGQAERDHGRSGKHKPAGQPLIPWGSTTTPANFPAGANMQSFWDTNTVWIPLNNGTVQQTSINNNFHPWRNQFLPVVWEFGQDASLFKDVRVGEAVRVRLNIDAFNVFNNPGIPTGVASNGLVSTRESGKGVARDAVHAAGELVVK